MIVALLNRCLKTQCTFLFHLYPVIYNYVQRPSEAVDEPAALAAAGAGPHPPAAILGADPEDIE